MRHFISTLLLVSAVTLFGSPENAGLYAPVHDGSVTLIGATSGAWRWLDVNDQAYSAAYQTTYSYTSANVTITYTTSGYDLIGHVSATDLKPHFAYQLKLLGFSGTASNELMGYRGRWWQEQWSSPSGPWINGHNLNIKGTGSSPNPNDLTYDANKVITNPDSETGFEYKHTAYRVFDYFITDANGDAEFDFVVNNSYHVLWKSSQGYSRTDGDDGRLLPYTFDVDPATETAYSTDYSNATVGVFGEWERKPLDAVDLLPGDYNCQFVLTEESFHGSGLAGQWALAMYGDVTFTIWAGSAEPDINLTSTSTTFPNTTVHGSSSLTFTVENNGAADLLLLGAPTVTFIGADAGLFATLSPPASPVISGASESFTVSYSPVSVGPHAVTMRITSNDPDTPDYDILLTGRSIAPPSDDDDWNDKLKDSVRCGIQSGQDQSLPYYLTLLLVMAICQYAGKLRLTRK